MNYPKVRNPSVKTNKKFKHSGVTTETTSVEFAYHQKECSTQINLS